MKLGLFLTPGAARTAYQAGAVQALISEGGLSFDVIGACSAGAVNGGFAATGQVERLAECWSRWRSRDILRPDWRGVLRGGLLWSASLMSNAPQKRGVIDLYLRHATITLGTRLRINLANLTTGDQEVFEWPGAPLALAEGVDAAVAVPAVVQPHEALGQQWVDGLTVDGFPLEWLLLETGVERAFVVGVAPRTPPSGASDGPLATALAAAEWNQYTEVTLGLERSATIDARARRWATAHADACQAITDVVADPDVHEELIAAVDAAFAAFSGVVRAPVEIIPILPERHIKMLFGDFRPARSRRLLDEGRRDARRVLADLAARTD